MEYKRFGSKILVRIDKDEEILEKVKELALKEKLKRNTTPTPSAAALRSFR